MGKLLAFFLHVSIFISIFFMIDIVKINAQEDLNYKNFRVEYNPKNINENELVKFFVLGEDFSYSQSLITWKVNGEVIDSGIGRTTFETRAGKVGKTNIITVQVENDLFNETQSVYITPNTTFILYEGSNSYVPPFYKGRALPNKEDEVRMAAISFEDSQISDFNLQKNNYRWIINDKEKQNINQENQIIFKEIVSFIDRIVNVRVIKQTPSGKKINESKTAILIQDTDPIFFKTDEKNLIKTELSLNESGNDFYLFVEPYFFTGKTRDDIDLIYEWKINGKLQNISRPWLVNLKSEKRATSIVEILINQNKKVSQYFKKTFRFTLNNL